MIALLLALGAQAQDICEGCPFPTVQAAVDSLPIGGSGVFFVGGGYHDGSVVIDGGRHLTLLALAPEPAVLTAEPGTGAVIELLEGSHLSMTAISVDANGLRAVDAREGSEVDLSFVILLGGGAVGEGALLRLRDGSNLDMFSSAMFGGLSAGEGGQILAEDSDVHLDSVTAFDGAGLTGGCLAARATGTRRTIHIENTTVDGSAGVLRGGAFNFTGEVDVLLDSSAFRACDSIEGGVVAVSGDGPVVEILSTVATDSAAVGSGGFLFQDGGEVSVAILAIGESIAAEGGGITLRSGQLTLQNLVISGSIVAGDGGAIHASGGTLWLESSLLIGNDAVNGGGLWLGPDVEVPRLSRTTLCENEAQVGAGAAILMTRDLEILNARFLDNLAFSEGGAVYHDSDASLRIRAANILGNSSSTGGAAGIATRGALDLTDAVVAFQSGGVGIQRIAGPPVSYGGGTVWWANAQGDADDLSPTTDGAVFADPQLLSYAPGEACLNVQDYGSWYGPLRDAGSADLLDLDGTRADIGAYGGPDATPADWTTDSDSDGFSIIYDCDESDPDTHPGADDPPYDGRDTNCDGADDFDADGDGYRPPEYGGTDCDDTLANVYPGAPELVLDPPMDQDCDQRIDADGDGVQPPLDCDDGDPEAYPGAVDGDPTRDLDCDGFVDGPQLTRPLSCDGTAGTSPASPAWILLLLAALRRRR